MSVGRWETRIRRAAELASMYPFASEGLRFYERVAGFQQSLYSEMGKAARPLASVRQPLNLAILLPRFSPFLALIEQIAPQPLAQSAAEIRSAGAGQWQDLLNDFWFVDSESQANLITSEALICWMFLQPYAEYLAEHTKQSLMNGTPHRCPICSSKPSVGVLRREGDGAKRSLVCALCSTEWPYRRLVCPACGEENPDKLVVYIAEGFQHVRVEACETCRRYITSIDLTKNGKAVPVVDELAAIPVSLWAKENGYTKLRTNLLGI